jgi:hypothetical protein
MHINPNIDLHGEVQPGCTASITMNLSRWLSYHIRIRTSNATFKCEKITSAAFTYMTPLIQFNPWKEFHIPCFVNLLALCEYRATHNLYYCALYTFMSLYHWHSRTMTASLSFSEGSKVVTSSSSAPTKYCRIRMTLPYVKEGSSWSSSLKELTWRPKVIVLVISPLVS